MEKLKYIELTNGDWYVPHTDVNNYTKTCFPIFKMENKENGIIEIEVAFYNQYATEADTKLLLYPNGIKLIKYSL
jgi:hypothetical protein